MSRAKETFNKKEIQKRKEKKRKDKVQKRLEKKESDSKTSPDDMIAYVDEYGRITSTPPEHEREKIKAEDIELGATRRLEEEEEDPIRKGTVTFFNDKKGFGFIKDSASKESVFVHVNNVLEDIKEGNAVTFEVEMSHKGPAAIKVKQLK